VCVHRYGWTALHYAAVQGQFDVAELLIGRGVDVRLRDKDGVTAAYRAQAAGNPDVVCLLQSLQADDSPNEDDLMTVVQPDEEDRSASQALYANVRKPIMTQNPNPGELDS